MYEEVEERVLKEARYIAETGATVRKTAEVFHFSKSTVHKDVTERLKKENMVEIKADGSAVLTGKGAIAAKAMSISREKFSSQLLQGTTPEERFVLISVLEKMLKNI